MPTKQMYKALSPNAQNMDIMNYIRSQTGFNYQDRIPIATQENLNNVYQTILCNYDLQNEFIKTLVNRIALTTISSKLIENPLAPLKKGVIRHGEFVNEYFVNIAKAHEFDQGVAENEVFKREIPDVEAVFHKLNLKNFYKVTISNEMLREAFLSDSGISDMVSRIIDSLYSGANYDEFLCMKNIIAEGANNGAFLPITIPAVTGDNIKDVVSTIKATSIKLTFPSTKYNAMGVLTLTKPEDQIILIDPEFEASMDVNVLAAAFNLPYAQFMANRIPIDDFGGITGVKAALVDRNFFMVFDFEQLFTENYNGQGLYWNYFYHVWKMFSYSPFSNAVLFTTETNSVQSVDVTPATATVAKGSTQQMTAVVATTGFAPKSVDWTVTGTETPTSSISNTGILSVATNEPNTTLTVKATSTFDPSKSDTATITVG